MRLLACGAKEKDRAKNPKNGRGRGERESSVRVARAGDAARGGLVARRHAPVDPAGSEGGPRRRAALPRTTEPRARRRSGKALTDNSIFAPRREPRGPQLDPATVQARGESFPHGPGRRAPLPTPSGPRPRLSPRPHLLVEVSSHVRPLRATREGGEDATLSSTSGESPPGPWGAKTRVQDAGARREVSQNVVRDEAITMGEGAPEREWPGVEAKALPMAADTMHFPRERRLDGGGRVDTRPGRPRPPARRRPRRRRSSLTPPRRGNALPAPPTTGTPNGTSPNGSSPRWTRPPTRRARPPWSKLEPRSRTSSVRNGALGLKYVHALSKRGCEDVNAL